MIVDIASWFCLATGSLFCVIGGIGLLRLPDLYSRTHGSAITDTLGAGLVLSGLILQAGLSEVAIKLVLVLAFMLITGPVAGHALVKAAYVRGVEPLTSDGGGAGADARGGTTSEGADSEPGASGSGETSRTAGEDACA